MGAKTIKVLAISVIFLMLLSTFAFAQQFSPDNQASKGIQQKTPSLSLSGQEYKTDLFTGSASYSYEVEVPDGVNGLEPQVSLSYNHHASLVDSPIGIGWNLNTPGIFRSINYTRADASDDYFYLSLNGINSKLIYDSTDGRYHTEQESFFNIRKLTGANNDLGEYWVVKTKDGTEYRFGYNFNSELASNIENYVIQWNLDLTKDTHGNSIYYDYLENPSNDQGTSYLSTVRYNNNLARIDFNYQFYYNNIPMKYLNGNRVLAGGKLSEINTKYNNLLVKRYAFGYKDVESKRVLSGIQEFGFDGVTSLPPTNFTYEEFSSGNSDFEPAQQWRLPYGVYFGDIVDEGVRLVDFNGDGYVDILRSKGGNNIEYWKSNGPNGGWTQQPSFNGLISNGFVDSYGGDLGARFVDLNGDMRIDILQRRKEGNGNIVTNVLINNNGTGFQSSNFNVPSSSASEIFFATNASGCYPGECPSGFQANSYNCNGQTCTLQCVRDTCGPNWQYVVNTLSDEPEWNDNDYDESDGEDTSFYPQANKCYQYELIGSNYDDGSSSECYDLTTDNNYGSYQTSCNSNDIDAYAGIGYRSINGGNSWLATLPSNLDPNTEYTHGFIGNVPNSYWDYLYLTIWSDDTTPDSQGEWTSFDEEICNDPWSTPQIINCAPNWNACNNWYASSRCGVGCAGQNIDPYVVVGVYEDYFGNLNDALTDNWGCSSNIDDNDYKNSNSVDYRIKEYDYTHQEQFLTCSQMADSGIIPLDVNSDGKTDIVKSDKNGVRKTWINTGSGFIEDSNWQLPEYFRFFNSSGSDEGVRFADVNGDGMTDVIRGSNKDLASGGGTILNAPPKQSLNNGRGWNAPIALASGFQTFVELNGNSTGVQIADLNGDGYPDLIKRNSQNSGLYWNNGANSWNYDTRWASLGQDVRFDKLYSQLIDVNADGMTDVVLAKDNNVKETYLNKAQKTYLLKKITNILGGETTIDYQKISDVDNRGQDNIFDLSFSGWVVKTVNNDNGIQNSQRIYGTDSYDYVGGYFDTKSKEFRGFNYVTQNSSNGVINKNWFYQDKHKKGLIYKQELLNLNGTLYKRNENTYAVQQNSQGYYSAILLSQTSTDIDRQNNSETVKVEYFYGLYGNVEQTRQMGNININGDERYKNIEYVYNLTSWIIDKPKKEYVTESAIITSNQLSEVKYYYDGGTYGQSPTFGDITKKVEWLDTGADPVTLFNYDSVGNLINTTDSLGHTTQYFYSPNNLYPVKEINALGQETNYTYNERIGSVERKMDSNGFATDYEYDVFGNVGKVIEPYDNSPEPTKLIDYNLYMRPVRAIEKQKKDSGAGTYDTYHYYDGFGNEIQIKSDAENQSFVTKNLYYDSDLREKAESVPHYTQTNSYSTPINVVATQYDYDFFDRVIKVTNPDNTVQSFNYTVNETYFYDENNKRKDFVYDAYDNIIQVREYNGGEIYLTNYDYNSEGSLLKITDSKQNNIEYDYDSLGRKIAMDDPDFGTISYIYDLNGNLYSQTYADGARINFRYDPLNRLVKKYTHSHTYNYTYDVLVNGTLFKEDTNNYEAYYGYDQRLRKVNETKIIDGENYTTAVDYDSSSRPKSIILPSSEIINYTYGMNALVSSILGVASVIYDEYNSPKTINYNNSIITAIYYDLSNHRITNISAGNKQNLQYLYDASGNLIAVHDGANNISYSMTYDDLHRLLTTGIVMPNMSYLNYAYRYDSINNLLSAVTPSGIVNYSYVNSPVAHSPNYIYSVQMPASTANFSISSMLKRVVLFNFGSQDRNYVNYDLKGNVISLLDKDYEYDSFNNLAKVYSVNGSNRQLIEDYSYDGNGKRIKKSIYGVNGTNTTTHYVGDLFVQNINDTGRYNETYYKLGMRVLGQKNSNGEVYYVHEDNLGSVDTLTNSSGDKVEKNIYEPFGKLIEGGAKSRYSYTGKEDDGKTGLYYYGARYYSPEFYRFTQPDSVLANIYDSQQLNRYAYARNNPYKYIDPTGNIPIIPLVIWAGFALWDAYDFYKNPTKANGAWLASNFIGAGAFSKAWKGAKAGMKTFDKLNDIRKLNTVKNGFSKTNDVGKVFLKDNTKDAIKKIPINKLYGHETNNPKNLFRAGAKTHHNNPIQVVRIGEEYMISDGVGRSMRAMKSGEKYVNAKMIGEYNDAQELNYLAKIKGRDGDVARLDKYWWENLVTKIDDVERWRKLN